MSEKNRGSSRSAQAAAALEEQRRQERRRRNLMVGGVVLAVLAVVAVGYVVARSLDTTAEVSAPAAGSELGLTIGPDDAPDDVIIYEDFLCPYCGELESATREDLARLADDGQVQVEYRPFNLLDNAGDYSARATGAFAVVLDASGPEIAKRFHDLLFEHQPSERGPFPDDDELVELAVEAGADEDEVRGPIEHHEGAEWVARATEAAKGTGLQGTPTVLLNGEPFQDYRTMEDLASNLIDRLQ